ncbi:MAG: serine/threonine-protein phosphatase [Lachnospiraceae bacterium]|nr:serine/threonine-protein phosphatase [Lachnospiraceae bacterium]
MWEQGKRQKNQDSLALWQMSRGKENRIMGIICDGIGGLQEGENASGYVVRQMASWFFARGCRIRGKKKLETEINQLTFQIHEELKAYGEGKGIRLGTTMTLFVAAGRRFYWYHAGDSRLYLLRRGKLYQLTGDNREEDGALNRAIGTGEWRAPTGRWKRFFGQDKLLLCTDGFYRGLSSEDICTCLSREIFQESQANRMLQQIGQRKLAMGEKDNISALYCGRYVERMR